MGCMKNERVCNTAVFCAGLSIPTQVLSLYVLDVTSSQWTVGACAD